MKRRFFPAVLERGPKGTFGAWFPDFPGCVAGGRSQQEAIERAEDALAQAVDALAEHGRPLPEPTPVEAIALPKGCDLVAYFMVGVDPPDPSERVNVYLPKSLLARADRHAAELGMSRSSFFGLAISSALATMPRLAIMAREGWVEPRAKLHKAGGLHAIKLKSPAKKPAR
jgi:predicted RNase H-like HicB family nuclease